MEKIKNGVYSINNGAWFICKIKNKWALLCKREYEYFKDNLPNFLQRFMVDTYITRNDLIESYKKEYFYKKDFENVELIKGGK